MSTTSTTILDLTVDLPVLDKGKWIGKGKKYPANPLDVPHEVLAYCNSVLEIPPSFLLQLPNSNLTVQEFLWFKLPSMHVNLLAFKANNCFHTSAPNVAITSIMEQEIPSTSFIEGVSQHARQAILDGKVSIVDPRYPNSFLPLWYITLWRRLVQVHKIQATWKSAVAWVEETHRKVNGSQPELGAVLREASFLLSQLRWAERTLIPGADGANTTTTAFSEFLSDNRWMQTDHINMMFSVLSDRAEENETVDAYLSVETLRFTHEIMKAKSQAHWGLSLKAPTFLKRLEERIREEEVKAVIFPAFLASEKHWITFRVDFENKEIAYGDSLSHRGTQNPSEIIKKLQWWLKHVLEGTKFTELGDALSHGRQNDFSDCGLVAANTAAHDAYDDPLWTPEIKIDHRVAWFIRLVKRHMTLENRSAEESSIPYPYPILNTPTSFLQDEPGASQLLVSNLLNPLKDNQFSISHLIHPSSLPESPHLETRSASTKDEHDESMAMDVDVVSNTPSESIELDRSLVLPIKQSSDDMDDTVQDVGPVEKARKRERSIEHVVQEEGTVGKCSRRDDSKLEMAASSMPIGGRSTASLYARLQNRKFASGNFVGTPAQDAKFLKKVQSLDSRAEVRDPKHVWHSKCDRVQTMQSPYNLANFKRHLNQCKGAFKKTKLSAAGNHRISDFFLRGPKQDEQSSNAILSLDGPHVLPCPGLQATVYPDIENALERTNALGGGGADVTAIARDLYKKDYRDLSDARKRQVKIAQSQDWKWRNDHKNSVIFADDCKKTISRSSLPKVKNSVPNPLADPPLQPCPSCLSLLSFKKFKNFLSVQMPADENLKYRRIEYRTERLNELYGKCDGLRDLVEKNADPLRIYSKGVLSGQYKGNEMFGTLLRAVVVKSEKERRGVGMQNFKYAPDFIELAHIIQGHSTRAYEAIRQFLPLPDVRTLQLHRSKQPRFPIGITDRNFALVIDILKQARYNGPLALACDDTKLQPSIRPMYDTERKGFYLVGGVGEPLHLPDPESFVRVVREAKIRKATKLRLWCLQIPLPKVPTIIFAALAITDDLDANTLFEYLRTIIRGFLSRNIMIASYASDGSMVERKVQSLLEEDADSVKSIPITHGYIGQPDYIVRLLFFDRQPIAIIQDPKHLAKTLKNNLSTGSRFLTFPGGPAMFGQLVEMVNSSDSPLYRRDVINADRQDDNAATRLLSASSLEWVSKHHPKNLGLVVFLFIAGELIDAYQSRKIDLITRVIMVLRVHFFLEMWERYLKLCNYSLARHSLSPQCLAIIKTLIQGFFQALLIFRDHSGDIRPLLLWLLATEVVEHIFGHCRSNVKDFTMHDFIHMVPRLFISLRQAALSSKYAGGRARASGYSHTYMDTRDINLVALSTYPSNQEINDASLIAFQEAESLFALMGISADTLYNPQTNITSLPSIETWFSEDDRDSESEGDDEVDEYQATEEVLERLEEADEDTGSKKQREDLEHYRNASIALSIQEQIDIASIPMPDAAEIEEAISDTASHISDTLSKVKTLILPAVRDPKPQNPFYGMDASAVDFTTLVQLRRDHQTRQALTGVRTSSKDMDSVATQELSERQRLLKEFSAIIREQGDKAIGSGLLRATRWTEKAGNVEAGNSANAAAVASAAATQALARRKTIFEKFNLPSELATAQITSIRNLKIAGADGMGIGYGMVLSPTLNKVVIMKVLTIYSKTGAGGKGSRHNIVSEVSNIMAISNLGGQVFENVVGSQFRELIQTGGIVTRHFDFIPPGAFLYALSSEPEVTQMALKIAQRDLVLFQKLQRSHDDVVKAVKAFRSRTGGDDEDD